MWERNRSVYGVEEETNLQAPLTALLPLPIKTMSLASVTPFGLYSPQHLLTTAHPPRHTHTDSHTLRAVHTSAPQLQARFKILLQAMSSHHML